LLDTQGRAHDLEAVLLSPLLRIGIEGVERGDLGELRARHDPPRFCWPDRAAPFNDDPRPLRPGASFPPPAAARHTSTTPRPAEPGRTPPGDEPRSGGYSEPCSRPDEGS
jgi:hypothetical protein